MTAARILEGLQYLAAATGETITEERLAIYTAELTNLHDEASFVQACRDLAQSSLWFPKLPEVIGAYRAAVARKPGPMQLQETRMTASQLKEQADQVRQLVADVGLRDIP